MLELKRGGYKTFQPIEINPMTQALIAFGANLGDAQLSLDEAVSRIAGHAGIEVVAVASPLVTAAVSGEDENVENRADLAPDYLNSVIRVETGISAETLFEFTRGLESEMGRQRKQRWGPRTIDLDIILFGEQIVDRPQLQIPHPRMSFRKFVIGPASEIAGELIDPVSGVTLKCLADRLQRLPGTILWITGDKEFAAAAETVEAVGGSNRTGWRFTIANNIEEVEVPLEDFRLMFFSNPEKSFGDAALGFAGPWLNLTGLGEAQCRREIRAAIQAMASKLN